MDHSKPLHKASDESYSETSSDAEHTTITSSIPEVPVTLKRKPFHNDNEGQFAELGIPRANIAISEEHPHGTTSGNYAAKHKHQTVLQQHITFFDPDNDGVIWPLDTYRGFRALGFNVFLSFGAILAVHSSFSYPSLPTYSIQPPSTKPSLLRWIYSYIPDPLFRIHIANIHRSNHGSNMGVFDSEGRFVPQSFEDVWTKYAGGRDSIGLEEVLGLLGGQRMIGDVVGWFHAFFEWVGTYLMLWPDDGRIKKEELRAIYDGSIFYIIAERRARLAQRGENKDGGISWAVGLACEKVTMGSILLVLFTFAVMIFFFYGFLVVLELGTTVLQRKAFEMYRQSRERAMMG